jgi:hypothetical protein
MSLLILVVDDEPDVEVLFRQQFRRDVSAFPRIFARRLSRPSTHHGRN